MGRQIKDELVRFCSENKRMCPMPSQWNVLWEMLPNRTRTGLSWQPAPPLILAAWHDTPAVLKQYSKMWEADDSRWHFLSTQRKTLAETAAGMKTFVIPPDADGQVQHSSIFILTDSNGQVRGIYDSADAVALQRLTADALTLAGAPTPKQPAALASWSLPGKQSDTSPGAKLYVSRGCAPCHAQVHVAPLLDGCFGRKVILQDGSSVLSDEAYLRESILDPTAQIVAGYAPLMPSYRDKLTDTELSRLVDYLKSLPAAPVSEAPAGSSQPPASGEVVDLVCQMRVPVRDSTLHTEWEGKTYYFCSPMCREQFQKNPTKFVSRPSTPHQQKGISP